MHTIKKKTTESEGKRKKRQGKERRGEERLVCNRLGCAVRAEGTWQLAKTRKIISSTGSKGRPVTTLSTIEELSTSEISQQL